MFVLERALTQILMILMVIGFGFHLWLKEK